MNLYGAEIGSPESSVGVKLLGDSLPFTIPSRLEVDYWKLEGCLGSETTRINLLLVYYTDRRDYTQKYASQQAQGVKHGEPEECEFDEPTAAGGQPGHAY